MLTHPEFKAGVVTTGFIDEHPELLQVTGKNWDFANVHQADQEKVMQVESAEYYNGGEFYALTKESSYSLSSEQT